MDEGGIAQCSSLYGTDYTVHVTLSFDFTDSDMLQGCMEEKSSLKL